MEETKDIQSNNINTIEHFVASSKDEITDILSKLANDSNQEESYDDIYIKFNKATDFYNTKLNIRNYNVDISVFDRMESMLNKPLHELFEKVLHIDHKDSSIYNIDNQITEELGISIEQFDEYIAKYKQLIQNYFNKIILNEKDITDSVIRRQKLLSWTQHIKDIDIITGKCDIDLANAGESFEKYIIKLTNEDESLKLKDKYEINKRCFAKLISISPQINSIEKIQKCIICIDRPVDTFMMPCGHTGCSECIKKHLYDRRYSTQNRNCYICKSNVTSIRQLYYS
jgi:hypothetical protein